MNYPTLTIHSREGRSILTTVELDGKPIPATRVLFDTGEHITGRVHVRLEFVANVDLQIEDTPLVVTDIEADSR